MDASDMVFQEGGSVDVEGETEIVRRASLAVDVHAGILHDHAQSRKALVCEVSRRFPGAPSNRNPMQVDIWCFTFSMLRHQLQVGNKVRQQYWIPILQNK